MNGKTVKLLRRWAKNSEENPEQVKTIWKRTPRNLRGRLGNEFKKDLENTQNNV